MKIQSLTISDFRWFSGDNKLDLTRSDGLPSDIVLIYAPNGSGKTSLTEAIEWTFTGKVERIDLLLKEYNRKPREGYILRNRDSVAADFGTVEISLADEEQSHVIRRSTTLLKNGRKNDYAEGTCDPSYSNPVELNGSRISDYILSQSKINEFLISASSGSLFKTYMSLSGRKRDLEFYYKLCGARPDLVTRLAEAKRLSGTAEHDLGRFKKRRQSLLKDLRAKVDVSYENFAAMFGRVIASDFAQLEGEKFVEILENANVAIQFLRAEIVNFGSIIGEVKCSSRERRQLVRRHRFSMQRDVVQRMSDEATHDLSRARSMSKAIDEFVACASDPEISEKLAKESKLLLMLDKNGKRSTRLADIIRAKEALHLHAQRQINEVLEEVARLNSWQSDIEIFCNEEKTSMQSITAWRENLRGAEQAIEKKKLQLRDIEKRDLTIIGAEIRQSYGLENQFAKHARLLKELNAADLEISRVDADILSNNSLSKRVSEFKSEAIILAREHDAKTCPACNHDFGSSVLLVNSILQISTVSDGALKQRKEALEIRRGGLASEIRVQEEELYSLLNKISIQLDTAVVSEEQRLQKLRVGLRRVQLVFTSFSEYYATSFPEEELSVHIGSALRVVCERQAKLKRVDEVRSHQLRRLRLLSAHATSEAVNLSVELELVKSSLVRLGYPQLERTLKEEWGVDVAVISTAHEECNKRFAEATRKIAEVAALAAAVDVEFQDLIQTNDTFSFEDRQRLNELDAKRATCRSILGALKTKLFDVNIFSIQRVAIKLDHLLLAATTLSNSLLASEELLELANQIVMTENQLKDVRQQKADLIEQLDQLDKALVECGDYFQKVVRSATSSDLLNDIYRLIDPHLSYHRIGFELDMTRGQEGLFIKSGRTNYHTDTDNDPDNSELISPSLFFSEAQSNVLSISLFLTKIAAASEHCFDFLIMDDPVQSMDDINAYAFIDMCRIYAERFKKQLIITTHDLSFYKLFQHRFPSSMFNFKYFDLDSKVRVYK